MNINDELNHSHPAIYINVGTVLVAPLTNRHNEVNVVIDIGKFKDFERFSILQNRSTKSCK